jgi:hypothetical protein
MENEPEKPRETEHEDIPVVQKVRIGTAGRVFAGTMTVPCAAGALHFLSEGDWGWGLFWSSLAGMAAYGALTGIDLYSKDPRHRTFRRTRPKGPPQN